ncbi:MAG: hypothetical protein HKN87_09430 [Saprospiraceae bacterium]|nr:hypothetical protein [Saprospiraceae bacterium]
MDPHKLDDFFRGKLENPDPPPFNEAHWKEARGMLHPRSGSRWQLGLLLLGIFFIGLFIFNKSVVHNGVLLSEDPSPETISSGVKPVVDANVDEQRQSVQRNSSVTPNEIPSEQGRDPLVQMNDLGFSDLVQDQAKHRPVVATSEIHSGESMDRNLVALKHTGKDMLLESSKENPVVMDETPMNISQKIGSRTTRLTMLDGREGFMPQSSYNELSTNLIGASIIVQRSRKSRVGVFGSIVLRPSTGESPVRGIILGADANRFISPSWFIGIRPSMHLSFNEPGFTKFEHHVSYSFESMNTTYGLHARILQLVRLPVFLGYEGNRHQLRLGLALEYLLGARGNLQEIAVEDDGIRVIKDLSSGWIETGAMKKFNTQIYGGYSFAFNSKVHFGFDIQYRPTEIFPQLSNPQSLAAGSRWYMGLTALFNLK